MRDKLIAIGFKEIPTARITGSLIYDLGRRRQLGISCLQTPNEMVYLSEILTDGNITDIIALRNFDYDGYTTYEDILRLISLINPTTQPPSSGNDDKQV